MIIGSAIRREYGPARNRLNVVHRIASKITKIRKEQ